MPARLRRHERGRRGDDGVPAADVVEKLAREPGARIGDLDALVVVDVHAEAVALAAFQAHLAPVDPLPAVHRPVDLVAPDLRAALRRLRKAAEVGGQDAKLTAVDAIVVRIVAPVRPLREIGIALGPVLVRPREERLVQPRHAGGVLGGGGHHADGIADSPFVQVVDGHDPDAVDALRQEAGKAKRQVRRRRRRQDDLRLDKARLVKAVGQLNGGFRGVLPQPGQHRPQVDEAVASLRDRDGADAQRPIDHRVDALAIGQEIRLLDRVILGLDPVGRGRAAHQAALVERAPGERLRAIRVAADRELEAVVQRRGDLALGERYAIAVDGQVIIVVDESEMHPVLFKAVPRQREGDVLAVGVAAGRERLHAAVLRLDFPAGSIIIILAGEQAGAAGRGLKAHPAGDRKRAAELKRVVVGHREIGFGALCRRARTADRCIGASVADAFGRRTHRRRIIGAAPPRRIGADAVRLAHVPDGSIVRVPGGGRTHAVHVRLAVVPADIEGDPLLQGRQANPEERLAGRIPRVQLIVERIAELVHKHDVRAVLLTCGVVKACHRLRRQAHKNWEVRQLGAGIPLHRQLGLIGRRRRRSFREEIICIGVDLPRVDARPLLI